MNDTTLDLQLRQQIQAAAEKLRGDFSGVFSTETIERLLFDSIEKLHATSRYRQYIPLLAERFTRERLHAAAKNEGLRMSDKPTVLFLCVHNAGRSQMAAGWLRHLAGDQVDVLTGGSNPGEQINPTAVAAMDEIGINISDEYPKPWTEETLGASDVVITMGCGDACPVIPGKRYLDWELQDPAERSLDEVRPIRDEIEQRVRGLLDELDIEPVS